MAELEIIGIPMSNYVRAIRMLCEEKGVPYKLTPARPHSAEVTAISPSGQIPWPTVSSGISLPPPKVWSM